MPAMYNPYSMFPATYQPVQPMSMMPQQSFAQPQTQQPKMMEWVEGEIGARAFQMPAGLPPDTAIPLWDSTGPVIYLKSWSRMGIPNNMIKLRYVQENQQSQQQALPSGQSGDTSQTQQNTQNFATKDDIESIRNEIREMLKNNQQNQNGNAQNNGNRGGTR